MGNPMAENLVLNGQYEVCVFDVDIGKSDRLVKLGARGADSVAHAVAGADLVMTSLPGPHQVAQVAFEQGLFDHIKPGSAWIDFSTNNLAVCRQIVEAADDRDIDYLDAPVSGGDEGARAGRLTVLVGGEEPVFQRFLPVLQVVGENICYLGQHGAGYSAKIAQVVLCYLHSLALSEALMLGIKGGVDHRGMLSIIQHSTGKSYVADRYGPAILSGDYDPSFTVGLAHKDMKLAMDMAENLGIELPMCELAATTYERAIHHFGFDANHLKVVRLLEEDNDTFLQV